VERKLTAILYADVCGYSRLMGKNEEATVQTLSAHRSLVRGLIEQHHGRLVDLAGDSILAEFPSVVNALECAIEAQTTLKAENANLSAEWRMEFRVGVNLGDVVVDGDRIYGNGINVAARLEGLAEPGGINISATVHEHVKNKLALRYEDLGEQVVKNIAEPVRVFRVLTEGSASPAKKAQGIGRKYVRRGVFSLAGLATIAAVGLLVQHLSIGPQHTAASIPPAASPALSLPDQPSIAVLPLTNESGDHEQEYFSDGITDDLITDLSRVPGLFVIARDSSFTYKGKPTKLQDVSKELGVKYVLGGSVRKAGEQLRITVQLADATTGTEFWAERYDRPLRDVFAAQDEIVRRIVTTLNLQLTLAQHGTPIPRSTDNLEAYDDLLRAVEYLRSITKSGNQKARELLERAIQLDPQYARAYAALGWNYYLGWGFGFSPDANDLDNGSRMAQQAVTLDDSLSDAHSVLAVIYVQKGKQEQALAEAQRGIVLNPNSALGYFWLAEVSINQWNGAGALAATEKAIRLDPRNRDNYLFHEGAAYCGLARWQEANLPLKSHSARYPDHIWAHALLAEDYAFLGDGHAAQAEEAAVERLVAANPNSSANYAALAEAKFALGKPEEELAAAERALRLAPDDPGSRPREGRAYTLLKRPEEAIAVLKECATSLPGSYIPHVWLAVDYSALGRDDAAREEVAEAVRLYPELSVERFFPAGSVQSKAVPAVARFRADLHKAGLK
jgi:adenylate cyclase